MKFLLTAVFVLMLSTSADAVDLSKALVRFDTIKGTMYLLERGWFNNQTYPLRFFKSHWNWQSKDRQWHSLVTPFIAIWNDNYHLVLDTGGRIFVTRKDNSSHFEIRLENGTWYTNAADEWLPLDDFR